MPVPVLNNSSEDDPDRDEKNISAQDGEKRGFSESADIGQQLSEDKPVSDTSEDSVGTLNEDFEDGRDTSEVRVHSEGEIEQEDVDFPGVDRKGSNTEDELDEEAAESVDSSEFYSIYTARGWYNPDEDLPAEPEITKGDSEQDNELITGDTQPVNVSSVEPPPTLDLNSPSKLPQVIHKVIIYQTRSIWMPPESLPRLMSLLRLIL